jgi:hypothetical protein
MRDRGPRPQQYGPDPRQEEGRGRGRRTASLLFATLLAVAAGAPAQEIVTAGGEQLVSASGDFPAIAFDDAQRGVVAWAEPGADGSAAIRARRLAGDTLAAPFQVNTQTANDPRDPRVALDGRGGFIVVWAAREVRGQIFRSNGRRRGVEQVLSPRNAGAAHPEVAMAGDGRFVVAWEQSHWDPMQAVRLATFAAGGGRLARPLTMPAIGWDANLVGAVSASADSVAVGWTEFTPCPSNPLDPVSAVATFDWSLQSLRDVDRLANDNPCVDGPQVLAMPNSELGPLGIFVGRRYSVQRFSPTDGTRIGPRTNVADLPSCDCERVRAVAGDGRGRFVFVWERLSSSGYELFAELYGREGKRRVERFAVSVAPSTAPQHPAAALTSDGTLVVVWRAGEGIVMRRFHFD